MKNRLSGFTIVVACGIAGLGIAGLGSTPTAWSQEAPAVPGARTGIKNDDFSITPTGGNGSFTVKANRAPVISLLEAVAQQTNCKIILSDEARERLTGVLLTIPAMTGPKPLEYLLGIFASSVGPRENYSRVSIAFSATGAPKPAAVRLGITNSLSWGKVGADTYLVVPRQESPSEIAAREQFDRAVAFAESHQRLETGKKQQSEQELPQARIWPDPNNPDYELPPAHVWPDPNAPDHELPRAHIWPLIPAG